MNTKQAAIPDAQRGVTVSTQADFDAAVSNEVPIIRIVGAKDHPRGDVIMIGSTGASRVIIHRNAHVAWIGGDAQIEAVSGHAVVDYIEEDARIALVTDYSQIDVLGGSAHARRLDGHAVVGRLTNNAIVGEQSGHSRVLDIEDDGIIFGAAGEKVTLLTQEQAMEIDAARHADWDRWKVAFDWEETAPPSL